MGTALIVLLGIASILWLIFLMIRKIIRMFIGLFQRKEKQEQPTVPLTITRPSVDDVVTSASVPAHSNVENVAISVHIPPRPIVTSSYNSAPKRDTLLWQVAEDCILNKMPNEPYALKQHIINMYGCGYYDAQEILEDLKIFGVIAVDEKHGLYVTSYSDVKDLQIDKAKGTAFLRQRRALIKEDMEAKLNALRENLERKEIAEKIKEKHRRRQLEKIVRQELIDSGELFGDQPKREKIPREIVDAVYTRDGGRCVYCGSTENLQLDHMIPFSKGGATTLENLQLLCQKCNIEKSNKIG